LASHTGRPARRTGLNVRERRVAGRSQATIRCPECGSDRIWRNGHRFLKDGRKIQRYLCRNCSFRFSKHTLNPEVEFNIGRKVLKGSDPRDCGAGDLGSDGKLPFQNLLDELPLTACKDVGPHDSTIIGESFINLFSHSGERRVGASAREAKNLAEA